MSYYDSTMTTDALWPTSATTASTYIALHGYYASSCHHPACALPRVGKRHHEAVCLKCGDVLARVRVEPPEARCEVRAAAPKTVSLRPTKQGTFRRSVERRHRASPRRFARPT